VNFDELMCRLREEDVRLSAEGDALHFDAPDGVISERLLAAMREHKPRLLAEAASVPRVVASGPCTWVQNFVACRHETGGNRRTWNVATRLDVTGPLDVAALDSAWARLTARHDALHTRFRRYTDHFVQETLEADPRPIPVRDVGSSDLDGWCEDLTREPFELDADSLIRVELARVSDRRWTLAIVQHHMITDAVSLDILLSELAALYTDAATGLASPLPSLPVRLAEHGRLQREHLDDRNLERLLAYWRGRLDGAPFGFALPGDRPRPATLSGRGRVEACRVEREPAERLAAFARAEGVTLFAVLLAAYGRLLTELLGSEEVVVNTNSANRTRREFEPLVGLLTTSVPLRLTLPPRATARDAVLLAAETALGAQDHQAVPTPRIVETLSIRQRPGAANFPQTWFVLNPPATTTLDMHGLSVRVSEIMIEGARSDFGTVVMPCDDGLEILSELSTDFLTPEIVRGWQRRYVELLERLVEDPSVEVAKW
jgi:hypothetical protein